MLKFLTGVFARLFRRRRCAARERTGLTTAQAVVKAEMDRFLDGDRTGARIIHGPRRSGKTHLAHMIHRERGGIVAVRSAAAAEEFRRNHRRMFGEDANVVTAERLPLAVRGIAAAVVMDVSRRQYHATRREAAVNNKVVYLHECGRVRDGLWTTSREGGGRDIISGIPDHWPKRYNACTDPCDTLDGPCACSAWHDEGDWVQMIAEYGLAGKAR